MPFPPSPSVLFSELRSGNVTAAAIITAIIAAGSAMRVIRTSRFLRLSAFIRAITEAASSAGGSSDIESSIRFISRASSSSLAQSGQDGMWRSNASLSPSSRESERYRNIMFLKSLCSYSIINNQNAPDNSYCHFRRRSGKKVPLCENFFQLGFCTVQPAFHSSDADAEYRGNVLV